MPRTWRKTLFANIYKDKHGHEIIVSRKGRTKRQRYNRADHPNPTLGFLKNERERLIKALETAAEKTAPGTLTADVAQYLTTLPDKSRRQQNAQIDLRPWIVRLGPIQRHAITSLQIRQALADWQQEGKAVSTINHRRQELLNLYNVLDGKGAANPVREVPRVRVRKGRPRGIPMPLVRKILSFVPYGPEKLRLRVMAYTGLPPMMIARMQPRDFDPAKRVVYVEARLKGAGLEGDTIPLSIRATAALRAYFAHGVRGVSYSRTRAAFTVAVGHAKREWHATTKAPWPAPANLKPYDLRHSWITWAVLTTRDIQGVSFLARHADISMTAEYARAGLRDAARQTIDVLERGTMPKQARK